MKIFTCLALLLTGCIIQVPQEVNINLNACVPISYKDNIIGSGVVIECIKKEDSYIIDVVTAKHVSVIPNICVSINGNYLTVEVRKHDTLDIAVLRCISASPVAPVKYQISDPRPLEIIYTVGYPLGISQVITTGIINHSVTNLNEGCWMCSSPAMPGNSGGGVFNIKGELLGITVCIAYTTNNNIDIPVPHLQLFIPVNKFSSWL